MGQSASWIVNKPSRRHMGLIDWCRPVTMWALFLHSDSFTFSVSAVQFLLLQLYQQRLPKSPDESMLLSPNTTSITGSHQEESFLHGCLHTVDFHQLLFEWLLWTITICVCMRACVCVCWDVLNGYACPLCFLYHTRLQDSNRFLLALLPGR